MNLAEKLLFLRKKAGWSAIKLSEQLGISNSLYYKYEKKDSRPPYETVLNLSKIYNVPVECLIDDNLDLPDGDGIGPRTPQYSNVYPLDDHVKIPALGIIRGGEPICTDQGEYEEVWADAKYGDGKHFMLKVQGDSMSPTIPDGAWAVIEQTDCAEPGKIVAFALDGEYATLKRYYPQPDGSVVLKGDNPKHTFEFHITQEQLNNGEAHIIGVCKHYKVDL